MYDTFRDTVIRMKTAVAIMAAGKGTRMSPGPPKVLRLLAGRPLLSHVIKTARSIAPEKLVVITGHGRAEVMESFRDEGVEFAVQEPQLGTGHALACAKQNFAGFDGAILVLSGDAPLVRPATLAKLINAHKRDKAAVTMLTCEMENPGAYGRVLRRGGAITGIVEAKDATADQLGIKEINSGIYIFDSGFLFPALARLKNNNAQAEYYLTDLVGMATGSGLLASAVITDYPPETRGVNTSEELAELEKIYMERTSP